MHRRLGAAEFRQRRARNQKVSRGLVAGCKQFATAIGKIRRFSGIRSSLPNRQNREILEKASKLCFDAKKNCRIVLRQPFSNID